MKIVESPELDIISNFLLAEFSQLSYLIRVEWSFATFYNGISSEKKLWYVSWIWISLICTKKDAVFIRNFTFRAKFAHCATAVISLIKYNGPAWNEMVLEPSIF